jgi:hypothetical protein
LDSWPIDRIQLSYSLDAAPQPFLEAVTMPATTVTPEVEAIPTATTVAATTVPAVTKRVTSKRSFSLADALGQDVATTNDNVIMPGDYKSLSKAGKKEKQEAAKKKKKTKKKKGTKKAGISKKPAAAKGVSVTASILEDPIAAYLDWDGITPSRKIILNRVHSNVWHKTLKTQMDNGFSEEDAKARAAKDAKAAKTRFLKAKGLLKGV